DFLGNPTAARSRTDYKDIVDLLARQEHEAASLANIDPGKEFPCLSSACVHSTANSMKTCSCAHTENFISRVIFVVDVLSICAFYGSAEPFAGIQTFVMRQTRLSLLNGAMSATTILLALSLASLAGAPEVQQASARPNTPHLNLDQVLSKL